LNEALAEIYRVLKPGGLYFASTFFIGDLKKLPTGGGFSTFESIEELNGYVTKAGFSSSGGATVVRKEGRGCAIIKAMKSPIPEKGSAGMLSELFNDTFKTSSGETGDSRLTIMEAAAIATTQAIETVTAAAESAAERAAEALAPPAEDTTDDALPPSPPN
jgi:hypothetical protein